MDTRQWPVNALIFPAAPILVIYATCFLCWDIWSGIYFPPEQDGGQALIGIALFLVPFFMMAGACLLGALTWVKRRGVPGWITACLRVPLIIGALMLSFAATGFFMGDPLAVFQYWQVPLTWLLYLASTGLFLYQQWDRLTR